MVRDVPALSATGLVAVGWRSAEDGLHLRARGQTEDVRLQCRCGRFHWIVRELTLPAGGQLLVTCHHCGTRVTFPFESGPTHAHG